MKLIHQTILRLLAVILMTAGLFGGVTAAYALSGSGTIDNPYKIGSTEDWNAFADLVNTGTNESACAILTSDIDISKGVGGGYRDNNNLSIIYRYYRGTFDGKGHIITLWNFTVNQNSSAPFIRTNYATIKNLRVKGTLTIPHRDGKTSDEQYKFAAGVVGYSYGSSIQNCISSITIDSRIKGDGSHGGIVGWESNTTIENCVFDGRLLGSSTYNCGGFVGSGSGNSSSIKNCIFDPAEITFSDSGCATFSRSTNISLSNCYYKTPFGTVQGTDARDNSVFTSTYLAGQMGDQWVSHCNKLYLKPFDRYVDITGWVSGSPANDPILHGGHRAVVTYSYGDYGSTWTYSNPPSSPGHYWVSTCPQTGWDENGVDLWNAWDIETTMDFCIVSAPTAATSATYNTTDQNLIATAGSAIVGTFYYKLNADGTWSTGLPTAKDAGEYKIYYYVKGDATHNDIGSESSPAGSISITIYPKEVSSPDIILNQTILTFDGSELKPEVTVKDVDGTVIAPSEYTVTYGNNIHITDAATVTITDNPGGNYTVNGSTTFTIIKADPTYTAPTAKNLTYNMGVQELINKGSTNHGTITYSIDGANFSTSLMPTGTDAKEYPTYYKITGDADHNDVDIVYLPVTIKPKPVDSPEILLSPDIYYYDGTAKEPNVTVRDSGTVIPPAEYTVVFSDNISAGTVTVTLKDNPGGNYDVSGTAQYTIKKQEPVVTPPTAMTGLIYNTSKQNLLMAGNVVGGTIEYSLNDTTYTTDIPQGQDAKQYSVYYRVKGDTNHSDRDPVQLFVTISPKTVSNPAINLDPQSFTYDGTEKKPDVTVKDGEVVVPSSEYAVDYSNNINVGTAMVIITDNTGGNYIVSGSANFTILSAGVGITPPTAKTDLVYDGTAQELITVGSAEGGTMYYGLSRSNYSTDPPTGTDAKKYTVYYKVVGDNNHDDSELGSVDVTISPKTLSDPEILLTPSSFVYDGTAKEPLVTVKDSDVVVPASEYTIEYSNNIEVGSGTVTITDNEGGNYVVSGTANFSINKGTADITPPTAMTGLVYNTMPQQLVTAGSAVGGTLEYSLDSLNYSTDVPKGTDAKKYTVYYRVKGDDNHADKAVASVDVTISSKQVSSPIITLSSTSMVYDGTEKKPTVTVKDGENIVPDSEYTVDYSDNVNVGTAMVIIMDKDGGNYIVNGTASFTIVSADARVTPPTAKTDLVYNGTAQSLITAGSVVGGTMEYSLDRNSYSVEIPTGVDAKEYKVYYRIKGDSNHGDGSAVSVSVTISPKTLSKPDIILDPTTFTFDGSEKTPTVTVKDGEITVPATEYTVSYSDNKNVGTATVTLTDNDGGNYNVSGTANFSIVGAVAGVTLPTAITGLVYNTKAQELVIAGSAVGGTMQYSLDNKTYSTKVPTGTNADQYTVYCRVVGDDNHVSMDPVTLIVTISPKALSNPTITLTPSLMVYDGKEQKPEVMVKDGEDVVPASEYTVTYSDNIEVGTATVTLTDNPGGNYTVSAMVTFMIYDPSTGFIAPVAISGLIYNGKAQNLVVAGTGVGGTLQYSLDGKNYSPLIPTATDAGTYKVYYKVVTNNGMGDINTGSVTATISPKMVALSITLQGAPESVPVITVVDGQGNLLTSNDYTAVITDGDGHVVIPNGNKLAVGYYVLTVKPVGNYSGPAVSVSFHVRRAYSFVFTVKSDLIAVILPFDREVPNGYHTYFFDRVGDDGNPVFKRIQAGKMSGGEPYLLKYEGSSATRSETRADRTIDLSPSSPGLIDVTIPIQSQVNQNMVFTGSFDDMTNTKALTEGAYLLQADNTWKPLDSSKANQGDNVCQEAFLAYIRFKDRSTPKPSLTVTLEPKKSDDPDDPNHDPDGVNAVILEDEYGHQEWYDLQGRRMETPQKGLNILRTEDGKTKKVIVR